jgi:hypothetical protein
MINFEDIKILYKLEGEEAASYLLLPEDFEGLDDSLTDRQKATIVAERELPNGAEFKVFIKEEDRIG